MKTKIIYYVLLMLGFYASAQDITPVSNGGLSNSSGRIDYVVGDLVSDTYGNSNGFANISFLNIVFQNASLSIATNEIVNPKVKIFPNPVSELLMVSGLENFNYILYDGKGVKLMSGKYTNGIVISQLQKGIYYLRILNEKNVESFKIIKQ